MKVIGVQMAVAFSDPETNFSRARQLIDRAAQEKPDVIVLPEMWNTGFFPKEGRAELADEAGQQTKQLLSELAKQYQVNIVGGSTLEKRGDTYRNTAFVFNRQGEQVAQYSKVHLFSYMGEQDYFEAGNELCVFELDGVKCGIIICYDVRFLEQVRSLCLHGIDVLFVPAQWPDKRIVHWQTLTRARAIENQIYVVAVNGCGTAGETQYGGYSAIYDPWGEILDQAGPEEVMIIADLNLELVETIRNTINVYRDRRVDVYQLG